MRSIENDGLFPVNQDAMSEMPAHGASQDDFFQVPTFSEQIVRLIAVRHAQNILLDNWAIVEHIGDIMAGRADYFHAALVSLVVGTGAGERREKRMVHIDD